MGIIQKNIFGDNIVFVVPEEQPRVLSTQLQSEIIVALSEFQVNGVVIHFVPTSEVEEFVASLIEFLRQNNFFVNTVARMGGSEIRRKEFSISQHPADKNFAIVKIGSVF